MLKKSLLILAFVATTIMLTGCGKDSTTTDNSVNADKTAKEAVKEVAKTTYIVSTPSTSPKAGIKDPTSGFVKINPTFDVNAIKEGERKIDWPKDKMAAELPAFPAGQVLEVINTDSQFCAYIANTNEKDFTAYYEKLATLGFEFGKTDSWEDFNLSSPKVAVNLRFGQDGPNVITVRAKKLAGTPATPAPAKK